MIQKNENISESVNSFDTGAIFPPRLGHDLSRNVSVVSGYAFYKNSNWGKDLFGDPEKSKISQKLKFFGMQQKATRQLLEASRQLLSILNAIKSIF